MRLHLEISDVVMTNQKTLFENLGRRLAELRREQGLTQAELADLAQCSQQMVAEYEAGKRNIPLLRLMQLADALGAPVDDLLKDSTPAARKRGPASKLDRLTEQIAKLPRSRQRFVVEMIENAVARAK